MAKQLIFDVPIVIDLWLNQGSAEITQNLLHTATLTDTKIWMTATSISFLDIKARQLLQQHEAVSTHFNEWLARIEILTDHGFEQTELYQQATCFQDAQIVAAARSLPGQNICIVTENPHFDTLNGQLPCKTPQQALEWLLQLKNKPSTKTLPFIDLATQQAYIRPDLERGLECVLRHGQYILGPEISKLETALSNYTGAKHCITVSSGTDALIISLMALGIKPDDEVITTPFTFIATVESIVLLGARPVFVDVKPHTCNINPDLIEASITKRTKAILPVSLYGQPADMEAINAIAAKYGLPVIEDAAQSFGAEYRGHKSCNLSTIGCTSFFPSKPLGCYGDGGAIFTNDDVIAQTCRELRVHGQTQRYRHAKIGVCARMDSLQSAVILAKLPRFTWELQLRQMVAKRYQQALENRTNTATSLEIKPLPWPTSDRSSVFAQYTILATNRDALQAKLQQAGIPTAVHYPLPITEQPAYLAFAASSTVPVAINLSTQVLSLPMGPDLTEKDQDQIIHCLLS